MIAPTITTLADASSAAYSMHAYVAPIIRAMAALASLVCVFFLVNAGFQYMTSSGRPEKLESAKHVMRNALLGLVVVLAAVVLTSILTHAFTHSSHEMSTHLPALNSIMSDDSANPIIAILLKAVTGFFNMIIQQAASPFLKGLSYFTSATPLISDNSSVFNLWLVIVGITDAIFVVVVALLGFQIMGASSFGLEEIEFKHLIPRLAAIFLCINCSAFLIDGIIEFSNAMIHALQYGVQPNSVWDVLTAVTKQSDGMNLASLLVMMTFVIFAFILLIYYVGRIVTLYIGAVLSPLVFLLWLVPGFRDFSETAGKTYLTTVFVLSIHVVILDLAASLFTSMTIGQSAPDALMSMIIGVATLIALLKTQGVLMQFSYASIGPRTARKLGGQFINGITSTSSTTQKLRTKVASHKQRKLQQAESKGGTSYIAANTPAAPRPTKPPKTGTTTAAPATTTKPPKQMEKP